MSGLASALGISPHADGEGIPSAGAARVSNTGREARRASRKAPRLASDKKALSGALIDWLGFSVHCEGSVLAFLKDDPSAFARRLVQSVFPDSPFVVMDVEHRGKNGYTSTAVITVAGNHAGFVALGGNRNTVNVQLSGVGCAAVRDWYTAAAKLQACAAKITRVDLAFDDYRGQHIDLNRWEAMARSGAIRASNGPAPAWRVYEGADSKTVYVGRKGSKELCVYEKGKQLGETHSPWLRAEVRIWAEDRVIPYAVLTQCLSFLRAAYNVLAELPGDVCTRIKTVKRTVEAKAKAAIAWAHRAVGPLIYVLQRALGKDRAADILFSDVRRFAVPRRFDGFTRDALDHHFREALCPF